MDTQQSAKHSQSKPNGQRLLRCTYGGLARLVGEQSNLAKVVALLAGQHLTLLAIGVDRAHDLTLLANQQREETAGSVCTQRLSSSSSNSRVTFSIM